MKTGERKKSEKAPFHTEVPLMEGLHVFSRSAGLKTFLAQLTPG